jgi:hypothetical protein
MARALREDAAPASARVEVSAPPNVGKAQFERPRRRASGNALTISFLVLAGTAAVFFGRGLNAAFNAMGTNGYLVFAATALLLSAWMWFSSEPALSK